MIDFKAEVLKVKPNASKAWLDYQNMIAPFRDFTEEEIPDMEWRRAYWNLVNKGVIPRPNGESNGN